MKELSLEKQVSLTKPDTAMYVHTKTKTGHCASPCLHVAGHQIRITNGVTPTILLHLVRNTTSRNILIASTHFTFLYLKENIASVNLFLTVLLSFLPAMTIP